MHWKSTVSSKLFAVAILASFTPNLVWAASTSASSGDASGTSARTAEQLKLDNEWADIIHEAGKQRMLLQKMTKEFLLVAKGTNAEANRQSMQMSIAEYDKAQASLNANPIVLNSERIKEVEHKVDVDWPPLKSIFESKVDTIGMDAESLKIVVDVDHRSEDLYTKSDAVVEALIDGAKAAGAAVSGAVVNIADRQTMLVQRMVKEAYLIGLGVEVQHNRELLQATAELYDASHNGYD